MLNILLHLLVQIYASLLSSDTVEALRRTAPEPITYEEAAINISSARVAGFVYTLDPDYLLTIAAHESNYNAGAVTVEIHGVSCGVMTPEPQKKCTEQSILDGYLAGAKHLLGWVKGARQIDKNWNMHQALLGYAGGYVLIDACKLGPYIHTRANGTQVNACLVPDFFEWRRQWIKRERNKPSKKEVT